MGIISDTEFTICYTKHILKVYTTGKLLLLQDMILPIKNIPD